MAERSLNRSVTVRGLWMLAVWGALIARPAPVVAEVVLEQISPKLSVAASMRTRWELWNWFEPKGAHTRDYNFIGNVARGAVLWKDDVVDVVAEAQNSALLNLPTAASAAKPQGNLGLGGVYYQHNRARNDASVFLKQGYLTIKRTGIEGLTIKGGRFEFSEGNEVLTGDPTLDWLKNTRLSQRLIGPFGWSHVGRSFDGGVVGFTYAPVNVTLMASHPTRGGFDLAGMHELDAIDLAYAAVNLTKPIAALPLDARLFYIYYDDRRGQTKTDNRADADRNNAVERGKDIQIHTGAGHAIAAVPTGAGPVDALLWGALQRGDWGLLEHSAWAWDSEVGFQPALPWKPWVRVGYGRSSGDDNPKDGKHGTFFQILPTVRPYAFSTLYNLMNAEDGFLQLILRPVPGLVSRTDLHSIRLTEGKDLWYQGSGATLPDRIRPEGFGYSGRPAFGNRDLFRVLETSLGYDWNKYVNTNIYYGHVFGSTVVRKIFAGDDADFGYVEMTLKL